MIAGLAGAGVDLSAADLVIGTSGGAAAAVELAGGGDPRGLIGFMMKPPRQTGEPGVRGTATGFSQVLRELIGSGLGGPEIRARLGAFARSAETVSQAECLRVVKGYLTVHQWPASRVVIAAVDVDSGELTAFSRDSGVPLVDAVAASCAVPGIYPPITIGDRDYFDGMVRSPVNAELAAGCDRVVVLAPIPEIRGLPGAALPDQLGPIEAAGGRTLLLSPDQRARALMGRETMDLSRRPEITQAGLDHGARVAAELAEFWRV
ncbi:hypothetical protein AOZ06_16500 [Kibdelosporangium phytohabitans]|uniref:PNPLA domain-containing protein n=1 Tax=Kibdelosporangium phytohabitans TaxID=860235 RepID=A0A0N9HTJ4_9PSEU|nr:hypothetical protein AOZ06_16500 [Kibdelosporangium phytohabitans]